MSLAVFVVLVVAKLVLSTYAVLVSNVVVLLVACDVLSTYAVLVSNVVSFVKLVVKLVLST